VASSVATCVCQHANMHHKPECRILHCECQKFVQATIRREADGSWMEHAQPSKGRSKGQGSE